MQNQNIVLHSAHVAAFRRYNAQIWLDAYERPNGWKPGPDSSGTVYLSLAAWELEQAARELERCTAVITEDRTQAAYQAHATPAHA